MKGNRANCADKMATNAEPKGQESSQVRTPAPWRARALTRMQSCFPLLADLCHEETEMQTSRIFKGHQRWRFFVCATFWFSHGFHLILIVETISQRSQQTISAGWMGLQKKTIFTLLVLNLYSLSFVFISLLSFWFIIHLLPRQLDNVPGVKGTYLPPPSPLNLFPLLIHNLNESSHHPPCSLS